VCGSWGNGSHLGDWGTRPARRGKRQAVGVREWRRIDIAECVKTQEAGSSRHQATFIHRVSVIVHCIIVVISENHNRNRVLLYYLFQENKSFGSKTPFAFILWCTGSCVKHNLFSLRYKLQATHGQRDADDDILK
jgi:hypothetical protein